MNIFRQPFRAQTLMALSTMVVVAACAREPSTGPQRAEAVTPLVTFPEELDPNCRDGRAQLFDECTDQLDLYEIARARAREESKVLLVSYGAEWCIWCHVFERHIDGYYSEFTYRFSSDETSEFYSGTLYERAKSDVSDEAHELSEYVAQHFVVVHIDYRNAPNGDAVLSASGAWEHYQNWLPYIYSVDDRGQFAATFDHERVEHRRDTADWYRGYDRTELLAVMRELHQAATRDAGG